jgi:hypothetical protein
MTIFDKIKKFFGFYKEPLKQNEEIKKQENNAVANLKKAKEYARQMSESQANKTVMTLNQLNDKIRNNIYFLENLIISLDKYPKYLKYKSKVEDLKKQSEDSLRIVMRIDKSAPYYQATMKSIVIHTNTVSKLVNIPY